jgi:hypothetical protein
MNTKGACLIAGSGHHTARFTKTDSDRSSPKFWIVALLDRRIEGIHIDMDDLADGM